MGEEQKKRRIRRKFSDEFKRDAVEIVRASGKPIAEVARELGIDRSHSPEASETWRDGRGSLRSRVFGPS